MRTYPYTKQDWTPLTNSLVHYAGGLRFDLSEICSALRDIAPSQRGKAKMSFFESLGGFGDVGVDGGGWTQTFEKVPYSPKLDSGFTVKNIIRSPGLYTHSKLEIQTEVFMGLDRDDQTQTFDIGFVMVSCKARHVDRANNSHERSIENNFPSHPFVGMPKDLARARVRVLETLKHTILKNVQGYINKEVKTFFQERLTEEWAIPDPKGFWTS